MTCALDCRNLDAVLRFIAILLLFVFPVMAEVLLKSAEEVANFPDNDSEKQPSVSLEAVVTYIDPSGTVFLADETGATFLSRVKNLSDFKPGQVISIQGTRLPGLFIGGIIAEKTEVIGSTPLPPPRSVNLRDLSSGKFHYQLVSIEGIGRSVERIDEAAAILNIAVQGGLLALRFDRAPANIDDFIDAKIRAVGLAAGGINDRRQLVSPYLKATSPEAAAIIEPADSEAPLVEISSFSKGWDDPAHMVAVKGTALSPMMEGSFYVRDHTGQIKVTPARKINVVPGTEVQVTGFPAKGKFAPFLDDAEVVVGDAVSFPYSTLMDDRTIRSTSFDGDLVMIEGILAGTNPYILVSSEKEILIIPPSGVMPELKTGSKLRLTGIWQVTATEINGYNLQPTSFALWLRSSDDIEVISAPPWWTQQRLGILVALITLAGLLALAWAAALRIQVSKQVRLIESKTQGEAVMEERQRIAREFHDTLEQELAGLSIRLDAVRSKVTKDVEAGLLGQLAKIVSRLQTETRDFINDLRETDHTPFPEALRDLIDHLRGTSTMKICVEKVEGDLPPRTAHHLIRIAREAVNNAVKYSEAEEVTVSFEGNVLTVSDSGRGFDPVCIPQGHFGLQGIRERCKRIGATCAIMSSPGNGTILRISLPNLVD